MTTFEILTKYEASFVIENLADNAQFTKKVSVCFDQLHQFRLRTGQTDQNEPIASRVTA
ncbi:hypothetical protein IZU99_02885 [Oscillospiraceae bacterium CM]|nr:hypothetical protein IZU99_02885 [Oscillospiraceae bacterium CM]